MASNQGQPFMSCLFPVAGRVFMLQLVSHLILYLQYGCNKDKQINSYSYRLQLASQCFFFLLHNSLLGTDQADPNRVQQVESARSFPRGVFTYRTSLPQVDR